MILVRKVQSSEFSPDSARGIVVGTGSFLGGEKQANVAVSDLRHPFSSLSMPTDTAKPRAIVLPSLRVAHVLRSRGTPQVHPAVVESVAIDVVGFKVSASSDELVKEHMVAGFVRPGSSVAVGEKPAPADNVLDVDQINNCHLALCQRNHRRAVTLGQGWPSSFSAQVRTREGAEARGLSEAYTLPRPEQTTASFTGKLEGHGDSNRCAAPPAGPTPARGFRLLQFYQNPRNRAENHLCC